MPIQVSCPSCRGMFNAPDTAAGKRAKCPTCGGVIDIQAPHSPAEEILEAEEEPAGGIDDEEFEVEPPAAAACRGGRAQAVPDVRRDDPEGRGEVPVLRRNFRSAAEGQGRCRGLRRHAVDGGLGRRDLWSRRRPHRRHYLHRPGKAERHEDVVGFVDHAGVFLRTLRDQHCSRGGGRRRDELGRHSRSLLPEGNLDAEGSQIVSVPLGKLDLL